MHSENLLNLSLVLITDEFPHRHAAGIGQAMYNFFEAYQGKLYVLVRHNESIKTDSERLRAQPVYYTDAQPELVYNRLAPYLNPLLKWWQYSGRHRKTLPKGLPHMAHSLVVVATTDPARLHMAWVLMRGGYRVVPFFMDDWLFQNGQRWWGGSIQQVARDILHNAPGCLFISSQLAGIFQQRYQYSNVPALILQNPATRRQPQPAELIPALPGKLLYAGNVWPMHADALIGLAKALHYLHSSGNNLLHLDIYSPPWQWEKYSHQLQGPGVQYKGWLPTVDAVRQQYTTAQWLVCCSSFDLAYTPYTAGSIQSKISDYVAAERPILYIGPDSSASWQFLNDLGCGIGLHSPKPEVIAEAIENVVTSQILYSKKANASSYAANTILQPLVVQQKLYTFLEALINVN